jgi:DNA-directed RNA polymerase specialized sigma24 family protein
MSADPPGGALSTLVQQWRLAISDADRRSAETRVAEVATELAKAGARSVGLPLEASLDVAQKVSERFLRRLHGGGPPPEAADQYVWRMAENAGRDWHRAERRRAANEERLAREQVISAPASPEEFWLDSEQREATARRVRELLDAAPENYRRVLTRFFLEECSIETIVDEYLQEEIATHEGEATALERSDLRHRVRQRIDAYLSRGKKWIRTRLAADGDRDVV